MKPKFRSLIAAFTPLSRSSLVFVLSLCTVTSVHADQTWTGDSLDGFWTSTGNWNGAAIPGSGDVATFNATSDTNTATTLGATFSIKGLKIVDPIAAVSIAAGNTLTLGSSGIDLSFATQNLSLASPIVAGVSQSWNVGTGRTLTVTSEISGTSITKSGDGTLLLTGTNIMAGSVTLSGGQITVRNGLALGPAATNTLNLANATTFRIESVNGASGSAVFVSNPIVVATASSATMTSSVVGNGYSGLISGDSASVYNIGAIGNLVQVSCSLGASTQQFGSFLGRVEITDGGSIRFSSTSGVNNGGASAIWDTNTTGGITCRNTGTINLGSLVGSGSVSGSSGANGTGTFVIGGRNEDCTFDGNIVDATAGSRIAAVTKTGTATLTLTSATGLTYGGATNVDAGTLKINGVKSGAGSTTVKTTSTLAGTGSIAGTTTIQNGGTLAPGNGGTGTLTFPATLNLSSGSILKINVGNTTATVASTGTLNLTTGATVDVNGFGTDGTYTIINTATGATVNGVPSIALTAVNGVSGKIYTFGSNPSAITMTVSSTDPTNYWNVDGDGTWDLASNWTKNAIPNLIAKVGPGVGGAGGFFTPLEFAITLDANQTIGTFIAQTDNVSILTINPGTITPGTLSFDNGATTSILTDILGDLVINAPVAVDAEGLVVDVAMRTNVTPNTPFLTTLNGVVNGSSAALTKSGLGTLVLAGDNTYGGGTIIGAGNVNINSITSLGNSASAATFSGGTLQLANALSGVTRSFQVSGTSSAIINTNGFDFGYDGVISPLGGATGGLVKNGGGTMTLTAAQTYTGATNVTGGALTVAGGSLTNSSASFVSSANLTLSSGSVAFNAGFNGNSSNPPSAIFINLTGGTFNSSSVTLGRNTSNTNIVTNPIAGSAVNGFYINGAAVNVAGNLNVGQGSNTNSTSSARMDSGSLTVSGGTFIQVSSPDRWSVLDVNGGVFTSTDAVTGVQIGSGLTGNDAFLVRNGTATVERFLLTQPAASTLTSRINLLGGTLYIGAGGIVGNNNAGVGILDLQLGTGILGAKANWGTLLGATLNGTTEIKAADAVDAAFDISIAGVVGGTGGLQKTGAGKLTLSGANIYQGSTLISAGNLAVTGDSSGALGAVTVASGAALSGNGNIGGDVTIQSGAHHALAVAATPGTQVTRTITGVLDLQASNILDLTSAGPIAGGVYILATATGGITGDLGSFTLSGGLTGTPSKSGNNLILTVSGSAYATWASSYGLQDPWLGVDPALNGTPGADPENDGIKNELEFALGGDPTLSSTAVLPTLAVTATHFVFTFNRADASEGEVALQFQSGTTLAVGSWAPLAIGVDSASSGSGVVVGENGAAADTVTVTIAKGANTTLFGRLQAVK